jgi:hypothetical protein
MDSFETREKLINLGRQLVAELSADDHADTFSRWVAHYVGEQIIAAEKSTGQEKAAAERQCFDAILALWSHRNKLPDGLRPFEGFEPILRALAQLDPNEPRPMYHLLYPLTAMDGEPSDVVKLVDFVLSLDRTARILIEFALNEATTKAARPETKSLLSNAMASSMTSDLHSINELMRRREALEPGEDAKAESVRRKRERFEELEKFCSLCESIRDSLREEFKTSDSTPH